MSHPLEICHTKGLPKGFWCAIGCSDSWQELVDTVLWFVADDTDILFYTYDDIEGEI